ncbi:MAG: hypothetical protein KF699_00985 [Phycisphaeraceae bacterium]|nr:hypothetical protein [Phycisphaeraceae bacterium]MBX3406072.1 hypothetical protein [Phycisphaeraceae bacterium]
MLVRLMTLIAAFLAAHPAQAETAQAGRSPHVKAQMAAETLAFAPGKRTFIAFRFDIAEKWHMYWRGQNDSGMPPQIDLTLPDGFKASPAQWPAPKRHTLPGGLLDYVYYTSLTVLVPIDVAMSVKAGGEATISARVEWMVCDEVCVLEEAEFRLTLPVRDASPSVEINPANAKIFAEARAKLPRPLPRDNPPVKIEWSGADVAIEARGAAMLTFYPDEDGVEVLSALTAATAKAPRLAFKVKPGAEKRLTGIIEVQREGVSSAETYVVDLAPKAGAKDRIDP